MPTLDDILADLNQRYGSGAPVDNSPMSPDVPPDFNAVQPTTAPPVPTPAAPPAPGFDSQGNPLPAGWDANRSKQPQTAPPVQPPAAAAPSVVATPSASSAMPSDQTWTAPDYYTKTAARESGNNPDAHNPNSSASGVYQFLDSTYEDMVLRHPDRHYTGKNDPQLMQDFTNDNVKDLTAGLGRPPTSIEVYTAHFLGAAGALKFLTAPPDTPVTQVVSPAAIQANARVFIGADGKPLTVGQVYSNVSNNMGFKDTQPLKSAGGGPAAPAAPAPAAPQSPGDQLYAKQKQDIDAYIAGQPAMWAKLTDLQGQYKKASEPTIDDKLADAMSQFQQQNSVAQASSHATAGGVLNNALPNATDFNHALQASHQIDIDARTARLNRAQQDYQMGAGALQAQNAQGATNLGLTGNLAKETGEFNLNSGKTALQLAQFGLEQQKAVGEQLEKLVPNPETRAVVSAQYDKQHIPNGSYSQNMQILNGIIQKVQQGTPGTPGSPAVPAQEAVADPDAPGIAGAPAVPGKPAVPAVPAVPGMQISVKEPATLQDVTLPDGKGGFSHEIVNTSTPEGLRRINELAKMPGYAATQQGAPQATTVTNTNSTGSGGASGAAAPLPLPQQQQNAIVMKSMVSSAQEILQIIKRDGGTGPLTANPLYKTLAAGLVQSGIIDPNDTSQSARQVFAKIMARIQNAQTAEDQKSTGSGSRGGYAMFNQINKGNLDDSALTPAIESFLDHQGRIADYNQRKAEHLITAEQAARENRTQNFNPQYEEMQFNRSNPYPAFSTHGLDTLEPSTTTAATTTAKTVPEKVIDGQIYHQVGGKWLIGAAPSTGGGTN